MLLIVGFVVAVEAPFHIVPKPQLVTRSLARPPAVAGRLEPAEDSETGIQIEDSETLGTL